MFLRRFLFPIFLCFTACSTKQSEAVRPGDHQLKLKSAWTPALPCKKREELFACVQQTSSVQDIVRNPVPVTLEIAKAK